MDFEKLNGLIPVVIQDWESLQVLMLGFMNRQAYEQTRREGYVTFYSRSKQQLWTKGETSGNYLEVKEMVLDCDQDSLLIKATPFVLFPAAARTGVIASLFSHTTYSISGVVMPFQVYATAVRNKPFG